MASRVCTSCGKEVAEGKRFCGGCGQPMETPDLTAPAQVTPFCRYCAATLTAGKRFCRQCGKPVTEAEPVVERPQTQAQATFETRASVCSLCGASMIPGKRFCRQCGNAVDAPTGPASVVASSSTNNDAPTPGGSSFPTPETEAQPAAPPSVAATEAPELGVDMPEPPAPSPVPSGEEESPIPLASSWEPVEEQPLLPPSASPVSPPTHQAPTVQLSGKRIVGISIGVAACLLLIAGGYWTWRMHAHPSASLAIPMQSAAGPPVPIAKPQNAEPVTAVAPQSGATPSSGNPEPSALSAQQVNSNAQPVIHSQQPSAPEPKTSRRQQQSATQQAASELPQAPLSPPIAVVQAVQNSGMFHYQGPPVPYNGQVVFNGLPASHLKFKFDTSAWLLTIKRNPNGTQKVTLTSQKQALQTNCNLGWEIVE